MERSKILKTVGILLLGFSAASDAVFFFEGAYQFALPLSIVTVSINANNTVMASIIGALAFFMPASTATQEVRYEPESVFSTCPSCQARFKNSNICFDLQDGKYKPICPNPSCEVELTEDYLPEPQMVMSR